MPEDEVTKRFFNYEVKVPSVLLGPVTVTKDNIEQTVIADGLFSASELCAGPYESDCEAAGISATG